MLTDQGLRHVKETNARGPFPSRHLRIESPLMHEFNEVWTGVQSWDTSRPAKRAPRQHPSWLLNMLQFYPAMTAFRQRFAEHVSWLRAAQVP